MCCYKKTVHFQVMCPICLWILVEPVAMPCKHIICLSCFNGTVSNACLACPLCRWERREDCEIEIISQEEVGPLVQKGFQGWDACPRTALGGDTEKVRSFTELPGFV